MSVIRSISLMGGAVQDWQYIDFAVEDTIGLETYYRIEEESVENAA